jgi:hypothetical protein
MDSSVVEKNDLTERAATVSGGNLSDLMSETWGALARHSDRIAEASLAVVGAAAAVVLIAATRGKALARLSDTGSKFSKLGKEGASVESTGSHTLSGTAEASAKPVQMVEITKTTKTTANTTQSGTQMSLFDDLPMPGPAGDLTVSKAVEPQRRIFMAADDPKSKLDFDQPGFVGQIRVKEIHRDGTIGQSKLMAVHHMNGSGTTPINAHFRQYIDEADLVATCHPEALVANPELQALRAKHLMTDTQGTLTVRRSSQRLWDPETKNYGYLFDVINEPMKSLIPRVSPNQLPLPLTSELFRAPLSLQIRTNPSLFAKSPESIWL